MNSHALIQAFLQQQTVTALPPAHDIAGVRYLKAGIVPFVRREPMLYYLMKPVARHKNLAAPAFQIGKGTRMYCLPDGSWRDMREGEGEGHRQETLAETALREGIEELGLVLPNIRWLFELGPYGFSSAVSGKARQMWLFAAEMASESDFLPAHQVEATTAERNWMTLGEFDIAGRADHRYILRDIETRLISHYAD